LRNFPVEVRGIWVRKTTSSGSQNLANLPSRCARRSSAVADAPGFNTTAAAGRSSHLG
jgi:hypothetical protein